MSERRRYGSPPVVEAIARLAWSEPADWGVTTPGVLFERLKDRYPAPPQSRNQFQAEIGQGGPASALGAISLKSGPSELVFATADGNKLLIVGPTAISAHALPPYEGWESLSARLREALPSVAEALNVEERFGEASLRYINRIVLPEPSIRFSDYLTIDFVLPPSFPRNLSGFIDRADVHYDDAPVKLSFTWASAPAPIDHSAFILDLDLTMAPDDTLNGDEALNALDDLKEREAAAFEGLITDTLRSMFDETR